MRRNILLLSLLFFIILKIIAQCDLRLPDIFSDHAVLQQNSSLYVWGWGHSTIPVKIICSWNLGDTVIAIPEKNCRWHTYVPTPAASQSSYSITFINGSEQKIINDILIGDIWLFSGQSNMEYNFRWKATDVGNDEMECTNNQIRFFKVAHAHNDFPQTDIHGKWELCDTGTIKNMSIVAYYLGRQINQSTKFPMGLIASYWSGTCVQPWIPKDTLEKNPLLYEQANDMESMSWSPATPSVIYNAMIYPLFRYGIKGIAWYQGESNVEHAEYYGNLLSAMIIGWRKQFGTDIPFYHIQLAPYSGYSKNNAAAILREQQQRILSLPRTGMISVADLVDNVNDIHPKLKKSAGVRLANLVLKEQYGKNELNPYSPTFENMIIAKNKAIINIRSVGKLIAKNKAISNFQIAGADKIFHAAKAEILKEKQIIITSQYVQQPIAVRYCFTNDAIPDLFDNSNHLPLMPFRTDNW